MQVVRAFSKGQARYRTPRPSGGEQTIQAARLGIVGMTPLLAAVFSSVALQSYRGVPEPPINVLVVDNILTEFLAGPANPFTAAAATEALSIIVGLLDTSSPNNGHSEVGAAVRAAIKSLGEALLQTQVGPKR